MMRAVTTERTADRLGDEARQSLDWPRLVEALQARADTALGRERCAAPVLERDPEVIRLWLRRVTQLREITREASLPLGGIRDVRAFVTSCAKGELLDGLDLLAIAETLGGLARARSFIVERAGESPDLQPLVEPIVPLPSLQSRLTASFDGQGQLSTITYPHLAEMRGRKAKLHAAIREQLEELVAGDEWAGTLQEDYFTQRNDRYVVPVKVEAKSLDLGIVHDTSGSGQTVYVEPREVVGLNNRLKMADAELRREEVAIVASLCEAVAVIAGDLRAGLRAAGALDAVVARARLAEDLGASEPRVAETPSVDLRGVRHPLLVLRGGDVVPNDVRLGDGVWAMILSGPNAGGKTVTLKTVGLCALMTRAGMHLPAGEGSAIHPFVHVLTAIGDPQSVEEDLSSFGGHLLALRQILEVLDDAQEPALVLLDEIAAGTDPQQGAALAASVLQALLDRGALALTTTHFAPLKALPGVDARLVNGRLEYDDEALRPTYRLTVGNPGRSYAFDIARRLGLPEDLLVRAEERLEPSHREIEDLLAELERERGDVRRRRDELEQARREIMVERAELERNGEVLKERLRTLQQEVLERFDTEVDGYREVVRGLIRDLQRGPSLRAAERTRKRIASGGREARQNLEKQLEQPLPGPDDGPDWSSVRVGDRVRVRSNDRLGELASIPDRKGRVEVLVGGARLRCKVGDLEPAPRERQRRGRGAVRTPAPDRDTRKTGLDEAMRHPGNTLDLIGERVDGALARIDRFLDDASLRGDDVVFLLHGFGTGVLRKAIRAHLAESEYVQEFRAAGERQGGDAVTAVRL